MKKSNAAGFAAEQLRFFAADLDRVVAVDGAVGHETRFIQKE